MAKTYVQTPENWARVTEYIIHNKDECLQRILNAKKCLLLDTCTIIQYANLGDDSKFFRYVYDTYDVILIPRIILIELAAEDKKVKEIHIAFLERLYREKEVYIFDEEWCYDFLKLAFDKTDRELNLILINTMQFVKKIFNNCVSAFFEDEAQIERYFKRTPTSEAYSSFFMDIRNEKESGDSLGEELISFIIILLSNIPDINHCKFELLTNDRNSFYGLLSTKRYIMNKHGWDAFMCRTTCNVAQILYENKYIDNQQLRDFIIVSHTQNVFRCFGAGKNDLECREYNFTVDEFIKILEYDSLFKVIY